MMLDYMQSILDEILLYLYAEESICHKLIRSSCKMSLTTKPSG